MMDSGNVNENSVSENNVTEQQNEKIFDAGDNEHVTYESPVGISSDKIPNVGKEFDTEEAAHQFYNEYARLMGFSVRKATGHSDVTGRMIYRKFVCSCEGKKGIDKRDVIVKRPRAEIRFNCGAYMTVNGRWTPKLKVTEFVAEHNHELVCQDQVHMLRSQRKISAIQAAQIDNIDNAGIAPKAGLDLIAEEVGGRDKVGYTLADMKNYLYTSRTIDMKEGDAGSILTYLQKKQYDDPNFFHAAQLDKNELITNIFWADARMKADYALFGDVVSFDTTHKKNKEGRPFALFIGVNHHKQTIIFGAALLYDETAKTFAWVFNTFLRVMNMKKPKTILTDQDAAMDSALKNSRDWDGVVHRLCIWHIYQNAAKHLSSVFERFPSFCEDFKSCVYDYDEEDDFFYAWNKMLDKYSLQQNDWLKDLFDIKEKWALVYGRKTFSADMTTTQRSESMHSVLKKYVNNKHNLLKFFRKFERLIDDRRYEELKADMRTCHSRPSLSLDVSILKHARSVYTHNVFKLFQAELSKAHDSSVEMISELETVLRYKITPWKKKYNHTVTYDNSSGKVSCSCRKFEFAGILCSHILKVLNIHHILEIPEMYISKRWTKHAKKGLSEDKFELPRPSPVTPGKKKEAQEKMRIGERYRELCRVLNQLVTRAALTEETFVSVKKFCFKKMEEVDIILGKGTTTLDPTPVPNGIDEGVPESNELEVTGRSEKQVSDSVDIDIHEFEPPINAEDRTITDFNGTRILGLKKKKDIKDKSGKRLKGTLEQAFTKKRKTKNNNSCQANLSFDNATDIQKVFVNNNQHPLEGGVQPAIVKRKQTKKNNSSTQLSSRNQNVRAGDYSPNTANFLQTTPYPPVIAPYYQNFGAGLPGWNLHQQALNMPSYASGLLHMPQFTYNLHHTERNQPHTSMVALLQAQAQVVPQPGLLFNNTTPTPQAAQPEILFNTTTPAPEAMQHNGSNQLRDPAKE